MDYESKFYLVWVISSLIIGIGGTYLYKIIRDIKQEQVGKQKYVMIFLGSTVFGIALMRGVFYLAL